MPQYLVRVWWRRYGTMTSSIQRRSQSRRRIFSVERWTP